MDNNTQFPPALIQRLGAWIGPENIRYFKHIKGLKGSVNTVLKLNFKRKHMPGHPTHFREGMQIRNWLRTQPETSTWNDADFDRNWAPAVELAIAEWAPPVQMPIFDLELLFQKYGDMVGLRKGGQWQCNSQQVTELRRAVVGGIGLMLIFQTVDMQGLKADDYKTFIIDANKRISDFWQKENLSYKAQNN